MERSCSTCKYLNRSKKKIEYNFYWYGCFKNGQVHVGVRKDLDLKEKDKQLARACCTLYEKREEEHEQLQLF